MNNNRRAIIVQARMSSRRLPGKTLKIIGGFPLIYYVLERLKLIGLPIIVATSTDASDDILVNFLENNGINFYRGSLENVLNRYIKTAEKYGIKEIIRITGDNPFVNIESLKKSLHLFDSYHYVDGIYEGGLIKGTGFELVSLKELKSIFSAKQEHLEHVTLSLREDIENDEKRIKLTPSKIDRYRDEIFLTCDYSEDFTLIKRILSFFDYSFNVSIEDIVDYLNTIPALKNINKSLHKQD